MEDCQTTACIGGLVCHLATPEEITRAAGIYDLSDNEVQEPSLLGAALLTYDAEDKDELENRRGLTQRKLSPGIPGRFSGISGTQFT
jgi:hypothetical protein